MIVVKMYNYYYYVIIPATSVTSIPPVQHVQRTTGLEITKKICIFFRKVSQKFYDIFPLEKFDFNLLVNHYVYTSPRLADNQ